ncbi:hypothetical protein RchiOBHm_Chr7g0184781 [Rosa chinensis]|uniref:Uncharacterized protein n=1 Tax=Rosa chinensis TaxID=74649 RepID=A0A2P6P3I1_ROSCH|nr:hypothetical protein RchiOBHm_Chr7g0184781 [Rosa chinensis]
MITLFFFLITVFYYCSVPLLLSLPQTFYRIVAMIDLWQKGDFTYCLYKLESPNG